MNEWHVARRQNVLRAIQRVLENQPAEFEYPTAYMRYERIVDDEHTSYANGAEDLQTKARFALGVCNLLQQLAPLRYIMARPKKAIDSDSQYWSNHRHMLEESAYKERGWWMPSVIVYDRYIEEVDRHQGVRSVIYQIMDCHYYLKEWLKEPKNDKEKDKFFIGGNSYSLSPGVCHLPT
jgi:hypothetical protein